MPDELDRLVEAARQLVAIEELLGGEYIPVGRRPLPEGPARAAAPAPAEEGRPPTVGDEAVPRPEAPGGAEASGAAVAVPAAAEPGAAAADMTPQQKAAVLREINDKEVKVCRRCGLHQGRAHTVFGEGNPHADLMFVGEGPGEDEDRTGRPFVGRAGELLTRMIQAMGLRREDVFIANIVKCRPPGNRAPTPEEVEACWDYLIRQIQTIRPKVIVALGNPAAHALLDTTVGITRLRGQWQLLPPIGVGLAGIRVMPTFHPAFLLRQYTPDNRMKVWSDLQQVMAELGIMPPATPR